MTNTQELRDMMEDTYEDRVAELKKLYVESEVKLKALDEAESKSQEVQSKFVAAFPDDRRLVLPVPPFDTLKKQLCDIKFDRTLAIDQLSAKLDELHQCQDSLRQKKAALTHSDSNLEMLANKIGRCNVTIESQNETLKTSKDVESRLRDENEQLRSSSKTKEDDFRTEMENIRSSSKDIESQLRDKLKKLQLSSSVLETTLKENESTIDSQNKALSVSKDNESRLRGDIEGLQSLSKVNEDRLQRATDESQRIESELKQRIARLDDELTSVKAEVSRLTKEMGESERAARQLDVQKQRVELDHKELEIKSDGLRAEIQEKVVQIEERNVEIKAKTSSLNDVEKELDEQAASFLQLSASLESVMKQLECVESQKLQCEHRLSVQNDKIAALQSSKQELSQRLDVAKHQKLILDDSVREHWRQVNKLHQSLDHIRQRKREYKAEMKFSNRHMRRFAGTVYSLSVDMDAKDLALISKNEDLQKTMARADRLHSDLEEAKISLKTKQEELDNEMRNMQNILKRHEEARLQQSQQHAQDLQASQDEKEKQRSTFLAELFEFSAASTEYPLALLTRLGLDTRVLPSEDIVDMTWDTSIRFDTSVMWSSSAKTQHLDPLDSSYPPAISKQRTRDAMIALVQVAVCVKSPGTDNAIGRQLWDAWALLETLDHHRVLCRSFLAMPVISLVQSILNRGPQFSPSVIWLTHQLGWVALRWLRDANYKDSFPDAKDVDSPLVRAGLYQLKNPQLSCFNALVSSIPCDGARRIKCSHEGVTLDLLIMLVDDSSTLLMFQDTTQGITVHHVLPNQVSVFIDLKTKIKYLVSEAGWIGSDGREKYASISNDTPLEVRRWLFSNVGRDI